MPLIVDLSVEEDGVSDSECTVVDDYGYCDATRVEYLDLSVDDDDFVVLSCEAVLSLSVPVQVALDPLDSFEFHPFSDEEDYNVFFE